MYLRVGRSAANLRAAVEAVHAGARQVGRDPSSIAIGLVLRTITPCGGRETAAILTDVDPGLARATRRRLAGDLAERGGVAVGCHFPGLQAGRVLQTGPH